MTAFLHHYSTRKSGAQSKQSFQLLDFVDHHAWKAFQTFFVSSFELEQNLFRSFEPKSVQLKIDRIAAVHFYWKLSFDQMWFLCISLTNTHRQQNTHTRICTQAYATHPQMHQTRIRLHDTWASLWENTYLQPHFLSKTLIREHATLKRLPNFVMLTPKRYPT